MKNYLNLSFLFSFCITSIFFFGTCVCRNETVVYVSPEGSDAAVGTRESPFLTLEKACSVVRELKSRGPVEIRLLEGTYYMPVPLIISPEDSGTERFPLIIKGEGTSVPVLSGGIPLPPFQKVTDRLWKIELADQSYYGDGIYQLFVNGQRAVRARTPNENTCFKTGPVTEMILDSASSTSSGRALQKIMLEPEQFSVLSSMKEPELQGVILSVFHAWDITRRYIRNLSVEDSSVFIEGNPMKPWNKLTNASQFIFENSASFMDVPGEWFFDESEKTVYYIPKPGEFISTSYAVNPVAEQLLIIKGSGSERVSNIRFENISFQYTRYRMPEGGDEPAQAAAPTNAAIMVDHAQNIHFSNCEICHTGNNALWFRNACVASKIIRCYFHDLGIGAVKIGTLDIPEDEQMLTKEILVDNNIFRSGGHVLPTGVGVAIFHSSDNTISHNEIADFYYTGVSVGWHWGYEYSPSKRNKILSNHIHHLGWGLLSDMGGVYTLGPPEGTVVNNNVIHHIYSYGYGGWGLYTDEGSTGILMENNLVYACKSSAFHQHYGKDNIIRNNIFVSQLRAQLEATRVEEHHSFSFVNNIIYYDKGFLYDKAWENVNFTADYNCYWNPENEVCFGKYSLEEWKQATSKDIHSIVTDPYFVNVGKSDFHFKNESVLKKIDFKQFEYLDAGVYGKKAWVAKATFDIQKEALFDQIVSACEEK